MRQRLMVAILAGVLGGSTAGASETPRYACTFEKGASWNVSDADFKTDTTTALEFEISNISRKKQTAELTTKTGRTDLKLVAAIDAMHFLEVTVSGYLTMTTLYGEGKRVPAVHSRHLGIVGQPVGGQLTGFCERK